MLVVVGIALLMIVSGLLVGSLKSQKDMAQPPELNSQTRA